ncbi:MAG TPA: hypothetical protein ENN05_02315, partial [Deltaproteobacteria bacterium]|nr:hypothetical protein [Deltaproteobacteria bacterium]
MKKMRVFELAKDLSIDTKELLKIAKDLAISVENNMSMLDVHDIDRIKKRVHKDTEKQEEDISQDTYVEKRVSANIIRRRARVSPPVDNETEKEPAATAAQEIPEKETSTVETELEKKEPVGKAKAVSGRKKTKAQTEEETAQPETEPEAQIEAIPEKKDKAPVEIVEEAQGVIPEKPEESAESVIGVSAEEKGKEEEDKKKKEKKKGKKPETAQVEEIKHDRQGVKKPKKIKEKEI